MRKFILPIIIFAWLNSWGQPARYFTANAHSHNDYEQAEPFWKAYRKGFGSIEADVFLVNDNLLVAHELKDTQYLRNFKNLYLEPISQNIIKNNGSVYADKRKKLILLVDFKTEAIPTIEALMRQLKPYPEIRKCKTLQIVISGTRPDINKFYKYPKYVQFDGRFSESYSRKNLKRVPLMSASFRTFSGWNGKDTLAAKERQRITEEIRKARKINRSVRFWATPDTQETWKLLIDLGVDFINTDKIDELTEFLKNK